MITCLRITYNDEDDMNNKERMIIAEFLVDNTDYRYKEDLLIKLNDARLNTLYKSYKKTDEEIEQMKDLIIETSKEIFVEDYPELVSIDPFINKKYNFTYYCKVAKERLEDRFIDTDDYDSLETLECVDL